MTRTLRLVRRRLVGSVFVLLIVVVGSFLMLQAAPGDAVDAYVVSMGGDAGLVESLRHAWGLDQSIWTRLANYLWALLHLDLGWSVTFSRPIRLLHPRIPFYVVPRGDGVFMLGATMIESDDRSRISARSMVELLNSAHALHPAFAEAEILEIGTDARPAFPDNLPRIRRDGSTVYVNGLYRHGFLLSPAISRMAASVILDNAYFPEVMDESDDQRRTA